MSPTQPSSLASPPSIAEVRAALKEVEGAAANLSMFSTDYEGAVELPSVGERRRRLRAGEPDPVATVSLVRNDGFLEGFGAAHGNGPYRAVLVGVPLGGTSLAAPGRLRVALGLLSNLGTALQLTGAAASAYLPLLIAPLALLKVATSVAGVAAKTPLIDAAVSMIPGLAGQSRVERSQEIGRLRALAFAKPPDYFVVQSNFETEAVGWAFWRWFRGEKLKDLGADQIFPGPNDLVVDTGSMSVLALAPTLPKAACHDFKTSKSVHHTNYFEQRDTLDFILGKLAVP